MIMAVFPGMVMVDGWMFDRERGFGMDGMYLKLRGNAKAL